MVNKTVVIVLTSSAQMGDGATPTGFHYEEMSTPYWVFKDAGLNVELCSIRGGQAPHDPSSLKPELADNPESVKRFIEDASATEALHHTRHIGEMDIDKIDAIYLAGGHGTMWDFPENPDLGKLLAEAYQQKKPIAAICHGVAGLIGVNDESGRPIITGKRINSFTNAEEKDIKLQDAVPFMLETALTDLGAEFVCAGKFEPYVAVDACLVTGQNPASAKGVANEVVSLLAA